MFFVELFKNKLKTQIIGKKIFYYEQTESTNDDIWTLLDKNKEDGILVIANNQTAGKGRGNNVWHANKGHDIVCSFLLKEKHNYQNIGIYSLLIPVGIINGIKQTTNIPLTIKWPNDLFYRDKKVGGILIESKKIDQSIYLNIGFGINVNSSICDFPKEILNNLNSLKNIYKSEVQREPLLANILNSIEKLLNNKKNIVKHWMHSCNHINKKVNIIHENKPTQAIFKTVNNRGQAIVNYQGKDIVINEPFF